MNVDDHEPTLLIVDDEPEILKSLCRLLAREPYNVRTAPNGASALELLQTQRVDVLLSDIDMPGMDGLELISLVRARHPEIVRMLLTGDASLDSALDAINMGEVHRYLTKPWRSHTLRETLREAFERLAQLRHQGLVDEHTRRLGRLNADLEQRYPGISDVQREHGVYVVNRSELARRVGELPLEVRRFFSTCAQTKVY